MEAYLLCNKSGVYVTPRRIDAFFFSKSPFAIEFWGKKSAESQYKRILLVWNQTFFNSVKKHEKLIWSYVKNTFVAADHEFMIFSIQIRGLMFFWKIFSNVGGAHNIWFLRIHRMQIYLKNVKWYKRKHTCKHLWIGFWILYKYEIGAKNWNVFLKSRFVQQKQLPPRKFHFIGAFLQNNICYLSSFFI